MLIGVLIVPWLDGFAKLLGQTLPFLEVAWARFTVQLIVILPLAWFLLVRRRWVRRAKASSQLATSA